MARRPLKFEECVAWARRRFDELFHEAPRQLQHNFPRAATTADGSPFWAGTKRHPAPQVFDPADADHWAFLAAASNLQASRSGP